MKMRMAILTDIPAITAIYNDALLHTTATFDTEPKSIVDRTLWFEQHSNKYPLIVAEQDGEIAGWASLSRWSDKQAYDDSAEISLYVDSKYRKQGIGKQLIVELMKLGKEGGLHVVIARITAGNDTSIHLHEQMDFRHVGVLKEVGKKFGKLLDVHMMQYIYA